MRHSRPPHSRVSSSRRRPRPQPLNVCVRPATSSASPAPGATRWSSVRARLPPSERRSRQATTSAASSSLESANHLCRSTSVRALICGLSDCSAAPRCHPYEGCPDPVSEPIATKRKPLAPSVESESPNVSRLQVLRDRSSSIAHARRSRVVGRTRAGRCVPKRQALYGSTSRRPGAGPALPSPAQCHGRGRVQRGLGGRHNARSKGHERLRELHEACEYEWHRGGGAAPCHECSRDV